jgi:hypothetical protein
MGKKADAFKKTGEKEIWSLKKPNINGIYLKI